MYMINAIGIRFNIGYKKVDDDNYECSLSVTAFNNSISKQSLYEVVYSKEEELSFEREAIDKAVGNIMSSLYNKCIKSIKLTDAMRTEYTKYFYGRCIRNICKGMFSNKILKYTDDGTLEFTILIPTGNRDCNIYGTIPAKIKCCIKDDTHFMSTFTIKHPSISNYEFLKYSVSRDISNLTKEEEKDFIHYYPLEYSKVYRDTICTNVTYMINGVDLHARVYADIDSLRKSAREALCISQKE